MSTCISPQGEFGDHILDDAYTCTRCLVLDEDALVDELRQARARLAEVEAERDALQRQRDEVWYRIDLWSDDPDTGLDHLLDVWTSHEKALAELEAARPVVEAAVASVAEILSEVPSARDSAWVRDHTKALIAAVDLYRSATSDHPPGHRYLSTSCLHGQHDQCGVKQAERGEPGPPHCKHCPSVCICPCHPSTTEEKP